MAFKNPFKAENFVGDLRGFWNEKEVTILSARVLVDKFTRTDGSPVLDNDTGEQLFSNILEIRGVDEDGRERREKYSLGAKTIPSADGRKLTKPDGVTPIEGFGKSSAAAKFGSALFDAAFDVDSLYDEETGELQLDSLVGARFIMRDEQKKDKAGNPKLDKRGFPDYTHFPVKFTGYTESVKRNTVQAAGNGAAIRDKAVLTVVEILTENSGKVSRTDLVRKLGSKLAKDADLNKVLALLSKPDFHQDVPWATDGTGYSLTTGDKIPF